MSRKPTPPMTREEVLALPAVVGLDEARRALGLGRQDAYRQAQDGTLPGLLPYDGRRIRVAVAPLLELLGLSATAPRTTARQEPNR